MKVFELLQTINADDYEDTDEVKILLDLPAIGPRATTSIKFAAFGFDWETGLLLTPERKLVPKTDKQDIFEAAFELLMFIATKPRKKESYETKIAANILIKYGRPDYQKFAHLYHPKRGTK
jgi:hypothetical protein